MLLHNDAESLVVNWVRPLAAMLCHAQTPLPLKDPPTSRCLKILRKEYKVHKKTFRFKTNAQPPLPLKDPPTISENFSQDQIF